MINEQLVDSVEAVRQEKSGCQHPMHGERIVHVHNDGAMEGSHSYPEGLGCICVVPVHTLQEFGLRGGPRGKRRLNTVQMDLDSIVPRDVVG